MIIRKQFFHFRIGFTILISILLLGLLFSQYLNGVIPGHHFLANENMPKVSNIWGALVIPIFTWFLLFRIEKRLFNKADSIVFPSQSLIGFLTALVFAIALGLSIQFGFKTFSNKVPVMLFALALFFPTYRAEYFLGFILGLTYFVGGVLPVIVGAVFVGISAVIYLFIRPLLIKVWEKIFAYKLR